MSYENRVRYDYRLAICQREVNHKYDSEALLSSEYLSTGEHVEWTVS